MKSKSDIRSGHADMDGIIDHIYDVAVDPVRYEALLDAWEAKIAPLREPGGASAHLATDEAAEALARHVERAAIFLDRADNTPDAVRLLSIVDGIEPSAALIVGSGMRIEAANSAAATVFAAQNGLPVTRLALPAASLDRLVRGIRAAFAGRPESRLIRLADAQAAGSSRNGRDERLTVFSLRPIVLGRENGRYMLVVSNELVWPTGLADILREAFDLTAAEVTILRSLVEGASVARIAMERGRSHETVKTQVRSILAKTSTHNQVELVRTALGLMDVVGATQRDVANAKPFDTVRDPLPADPDFVTLPRPGGRVADHLATGDPRGSAMVHFCMDFGLIRWPERARSYMVSRKLKILAPVRPGYGETSPAPSRESWLDTILDDTLAMMDHHGIARAPVICSSGDAFFAYHLASRAPDRISAILNAAAGFPVTNPAQYERMEKWHRFILANASYAPAILPFLVKAGFSLARRLGKVEFVRTIFRGSPADNALFDEAETRDALLAGSRITLSEVHSAHHAYAVEVMMKQGDWADLIDNCPVPVHVWHGDHDPQMPPETMAEIRERFTGPRYHHVPDQGQLMLFGMWEVILDTASRYLE